MIETYRGCAYPDQMDHMGHMNVRWYVAKFDEASWQLFSAIGLSNRTMIERGCGMAAVEQTLRYSAEVHAGDVLLVRSVVRAVTRQTLRFEHHMTNLETEQEVSHCRTIAVHLNLQTRRPTPLPDSVRTRCVHLFEATLE